MLISLASARTNAGPGTEPAGWRCRCANQSLCSPLSTTPRVRDREVFAYYEDAYGAEGMERLLASGQVTTIAACGGDDRLDDDHLCMAHAAGVRVVMGCVGCDVWGNTEACVGHTASVGYNFSNTTARDAFVQQTVASNHDYGYDGIALDIEGGVSTSQGDGLTALVTELRQALPSSAQVRCPVYCPHVPWRSLPVYHVRDHIISRYPF
jgi:hypothetical protein